MSPSKPLILMFVLTTLGLSGCWSSEPTTVPVTGLVLYHGEPVAGAEISFIPRGRTLAEGEQPPRGLTNSAGLFSLSTRIDEDETLSGAAPGDYVVTVLKLNIITGSPEDALQAARKDRNKKTKGQIPPHYANPDLSGLKFHVMNQAEIAEAEEERANLPEGESQDSRKPRLVEKDGVKGFVDPDIAPDPLEEEGGPLFKAHKYATVNQVNDFILVLTDDVPVTE